MSTARRRLARAEMRVRAIYPPPPDPEQERRETERFFNQWAGDIVRVAHLAREQRGRGESRDRPISTCSPLEIMAEAVSFGGFQPPESVRRALRETLDAQVWPEITDPDQLERLNAAPREALRRAFLMYSEQTVGPGAGELLTLVSTPRA